MEHLFGVLELDVGLAREVLEREIGRARPVVALGALEIEEPVLVEVAEDELGEPALGVGEVGELELPAEVVDEGGLLGEVGLDGGKVVVAAPRLRKGLLEGAVLQKLLPVDLVDLLLVLGPLELGGLVVHALGDLGVGLALLHDRFAPVDLPLGVLARGPRVDLVVREDRVGVELLPNLVNQLESRQLQEADRLLKLRRHHELLAHLQLLLDLHALRHQGNIARPGRER